MNEGVDELQVRAAEHQVLFRTVNERMVALNETFKDFLDTAVFVCECAEMGCVERFEITLDEYAKVRANPRWFIVAPSETHVRAGWEFVVEERSSYVVLEKIGVGALIAEGVSPY
jgi:hypothetical protein